VTFVTTYLTCGVVTITQFDTKFSPKCDWSFPVDFVVLNTNPVAKLAYHIRILKKLRLNVSKRTILTIFITRLWLK